MYNSGENWKPVRATAKLFSQVDTEEIAQLPLKIFINEMNVLICHASPSSNKKGWKKSIDGELAKDLLAEPAATIVCGHWHSINEQSWENKKLLMIGSVGVPLHGKHQAEYSILESRNGDLSVENRFVDYDVESTVKKYVESGFVAESAPISWLLLDEIIAAERRISPFIAWRNSDSAIADLKWQEAAELYFRKINRWDQIKKAAKI